MKSKMAVRTEFHTNNIKLLYLGKGNINCQRNKSVKVQKKQIFASKKIVFNLKKNIDQLILIYQAKKYGKDAFDNENKK